MADLSELERAVVTLMASLHPSCEVALMSQLALSTVSSRASNIAGFSTYIAVGKGAPLIDGGASFTLDGVEGTANQLAHGAGFTLFFEKGLLHVIEGYTYDEDWPKSSAQFALFAGKYATNASPGAMR